MIHLQILERLLNQSIWLNRLLIIPEFRDVLVKQRYKSLARKKPLSLVNNNKGLTLNAIAHNFDPKRMFFQNLSKRPDLISKPLSCDVSVIQNASRMKVLLIGARTEAEIFSFSLCGFSQDNIFAIDLASYTPLIATMNAEDLDYPKDYFDVIVLGWVLEFVQDIDKVKSEVIRCLKPGGIIGIGAMYHPSSQDMIEYSQIKSHSDRVWSPKSTKEIVAFFGVSEVIFNSDVTHIDEDKRNDLILIGRLSK